MAAGEQSKGGPEVRADEEWKKSVAEEKARMRSAEAPAQGDAAGRGPLPEASLEVFIAGLATQTLVALGDLPHSTTGKAEADLEEASYLIDTIGMLEGKTRGNLTPRESSYIKNILTDLRIRYVNATQTGQSRQGQAHPTRSQ